MVSVTSPNSPERSKLYPFNPMKKSIFYLITVLFLVACSASKVLTPTEADVTRVSDKYSEVSLAALSSGKALYQQHCNRCHGYRKLSAWNESEWKEIIPDMVKQTNEKARKTLISEKGEQQILLYVLTMREAVPVK